MTTSNKYAGLKVALEVLEKLYNVNEKSGQIISYSQFYVKELREKVDVKQDYVFWLLKDSPYHMQFNPSVSILTSKGQSIPHTI